MGDLISRKALMEELVKAEEECEEVMCVPSWATALRVIRSQPTAYDIEEIVKRMVDAAKSGEVMMDSGVKRVSSFVQINEAIEIVKGGKA